MRATCGLPIMELRGHQRILNPGRQNASVIPADSFFRIRIRFCVPPENAATRSAARQVEEAFFVYVYAFAFPRKTPPPDP
ncbi:MAG: hypothetical protein MUF04_02365, partial [Akkermansiaceae bacterium]|nr:hypothetical protein [Akkermansiaceae bacterium]